MGLPNPFTNQMLSSCRKVPLKHFGDGMGASGRIGSPTLFLYPIELKLVSWIAANPVLSGSAWVLNCITLMRLGSLTGSRAEQAPRAGLPPQSGHSNVRQKAQARRFP